MDADRVPIVSCRCVPPHQHIGPGIKCVLEKSKEAEQAGTHQKVHPSCCDSVYLDTCYGVEVLVVCERTTMQRLA
eukprot:scaffold544_cov320-Pavlova_lutheri.AAC.17